MWIEFMIEDELYRDFKVACDARGIDVEEILTLYIRSVTNTHKKYKMLGPDDIMPYGKYKGAKVEDMIRGDPRYVRWMLTEATEPIALDASGIEILAQVIETGDVMS